MNWFVHNQTLKNCNYLTITKYVCVKHKIQFRLGAIIVIQNIINELFINRIFALDLKWLIQAFYPQNQSAVTYRSGQGPYSENPYPFQLYT